MRKAINILTLAIALPWLSGAAHAQAPTLQPAQELPPMPKLNLTLEQRHTIKEFIKDIRGQATTRDVQPAIGDKIPQDINPSPMPTVVGQKIPQVKAHRFFVTGEEIVIVEPRDNKVADIIKLSDN